MLTFFNRIWKIVHLDFLHRHFVKLQESIIEYRCEWRLIGEIIGLSALFYALSFLTVYVICLAVDVEVPFIFIAFILPVIYLLEAIPISINGLGIREGAFVFFFTRIGLQLEQAFAVSLVILLYRLIKTLMGGAFFLLNQTNRGWLNRRAKDKMTTSNAVHPDADQVG
jgi:uncharacterized protein (TIRG00374 family)